ncbi:J domain-containing protein [Actinoplanes flavus]|uniref:J domain-containing protein n=1 Tax=Actinoplanes flavus TaxID=2820290 RepID=A0ABS3UXQ7_9ACTN|nr:J domain-containing protein [Actinoplanes flavus]MBO3743371.1 J domain-containing protein [Actinoplanes flavus]
MTGRFRDLHGHDPYRVLGVAPTATRQEISRARRDRQREAHPDGGAAADDRAKLINTAADILLDDTLRRQYDDSRVPGPPPPTYTSPYHYHVPPPSGGGALRTVLITLAVVTLVCFVGCLLGLLGPAAETVRLTPLIQR